MGQEAMPKPNCEINELRLFALGRIPRCNRCPRYHALVAADAGLPLLLPTLPPAPLFCSHQICAPLVDGGIGSHTQTVRGASA